VVGLVLTLLVAYVLFQVKLVVVLALLAVLYATAIERPVRALERWRIPRRAAVLAIDVALVAGLVVPVLLLAPAAQHELARFRREEPARLHQTDAAWATSPHAILRGPGRRALDRVIAAIETPAAPSKRAVGVFAGVVKVVIAGLACLAMAYYYLAEKELLRRVALEAIHPRNRERWDRLWDDVEGVIGGWLRTRLLLAPIAAIVTTLAFGFLRLPYWPLLGLLAGLTEPIPILGAWIGGVPAVFLALTVSWQRALVVVAFILVRQGVVDAVVVPRLSKRELGMSPLVVLVAVVAGTEFFGPIGALLAIPLAAAIQVLIADALARRGVTGQAVGAPRWRWLRGSPSNR
jgi:predicted PurR-regulated permease PerM